jgi:hypothetical protein
MTQITIITTTLMMPVFLFSYLHSHLGQNSCSLPCSSLPIFGRMTPSQLLQNQQITTRKSRICWVPFFWGDIADVHDPRHVRRLCAVGDRRDAGTDAFASFVVVGLRLAFVNVRLCKIRVFVGGLPVTAQRRKKCTEARQPASF